MATIKVKYMVVTSKTAAWSHEAPYFSFSATRTKEELKTELLAKAKCMGHGTLLLRDEDDDFAEWDEPVPLPTSGTICVKVAVDSTGSQGLRLCLGRYIAFQQTQCMCVADASANIVQMPYLQMLRLHTLLSPDCAAPAFNLYAQTHVVLCS